MIRPVVSMMRTTARLAFAGALMILAGPVSAGEREDAQAALAAAEAAVAEAREHLALWTTALTTLTQSRSAWERGDYPAVQHWSHEAQALAELGLEQAGIRRAAPPSR
ncbi:MAG: DUF4398 domain-containing protein [Burkholderiales bacterium]